MTDFVISPHAIPTVPVTTGGLFPVRRIFCIGKNYADHVKEMGGSPDDTPPVFFTKPADAVVSPMVPVPEVHYPTRTENLHYEGELVLALKSGGTNISEAYALSHVYGLALGCDFTRRDLQAAAKDKGGPWDTAKAFDQSAAVGPIDPDARLSENLSFDLSVNGEVRQSARVGAMIYPPARIIAELSTFFELKAGDLIFTGTPEGVGAVARGDRIEMSSPDVPGLGFTLI